MGVNPERFATEAKFAALVGVAPIPASFGKTTRHRLVRNMSDTGTNTYVARRRAEGKNTKDIMTCLERGIAREIYGQPHHQPARVAGEQRKAQTISLQAADALHVWPANPSKLERGLTRDDVCYQRYARWLNGY